MGAVLVTGGSGLVGRSLVRSLVAGGQRVRILSRNGSNPVPHPLVSVQRGNLLRAADVKAALQDCSTVFHCAGEKLDTTNMLATNVTGTELLFDLARRQRVRFFCHFSSVGVIGKVAVRLVDETTPCAPMNHYEETKLAAEKIVSAGLDSGVVAILRPTNVFDESTVAALLDRSCRARMRLRFKGNELSHLVYVEDVTAAALFCLQTNSNAPVATYIISSDEEPGGTHLEVQACLAAMSDTVPAPPALSMPVWMAHWVRSLRRPVNRPDVIYSARRLTEAGFEPPFGRARGLQKSLALLAPVNP
ncbi:MAG: NAD-dependent epimerase/dehydratase family protein [Proteobacteria bacterium]|nr:NAD-dependent epimerase/dehydratase family protein [Pseudomonadota bacterium]